MSTVVTDRGSDRLEASRTRMICASVDSGDAKNAIEMMFDKIPGVCAPREKENQAIRKEIRRIRADHR